MPDSASQDGPTGPRPVAADARREPPRTCGRCGGRLDVQVYPTGYRASCRRCDGLHPARDAARIPVTRTDEPPDEAGG